MRAKDYMMRLLYAERQMMYLTAEAERMDCQIMRITQILRDNSSGQSGNGDGKASAIASLIDIRDGIMADIATISTIKPQVLLVIKQIQSQKQREVIFRRYVSAQSFDDIATAMGFCVRHVLSLHGKGLIAVQNIIDKNDMIR